MKPGHGKLKGSQYERDLCTKLSLWVSGGTRRDVFWRSAMSGGRATVHKRKGELQRQAGDICAVAPEGHVFTDRYYIEVKAYKNLALASFIFKGEGITAKFWRKTYAEARTYKKLPLLILKQNRFPPLLVVGAEDMETWRGVASTFASFRFGEIGCVVYSLDEVLTTRYKELACPENLRYVNDYAPSKQRRKRCRLIKTTSKFTQNA